MNELVLDEDEGFIPIDAETVDGINEVSDEIMCPLLCDIIFILFYQKRANAGHSRQGERMKNNK